MPYLETIEADLVRAKELLAEGRAALDTQLAEVIGADTDLRRQIVAVMGGTIYGKDTYTAYKLLESFVGEIERLQMALAQIGLRRVNDAELHP